jgi:hypothetical protein
VVLPITAEAFARLPADRSAVLVAGRLRHRPQAAPDVVERGHRVARLLLPAATAAGGFTSTRLVVATARCPDSAVRPPVCAVLGAPPPSGVLDGPPDLVVLLGEVDDDPGAWLGLGCSEVWVVTARGAAVVTAAGRVLHPARGALAHGTLPLQLPLGLACRAAAVVLPATGPSSGVG